MTQDTKQTVRRDDYDVEKSDMMWEETVVENESELSLNKIPFPLTYVEKDDGDDDDLINNSLESDLISWHLRTHLSHYVLCMKHPLASELELSHQVLGE